MTHKFEICLYQPDMPQNVAVAIRTSACLGFPLHIINPLNFSFTDKRFRGAVMDYMQHCNLIRHENWENFINRIDPEKTKNIYLKTPTITDLKDIKIYDQSIFNKIVEYPPNKLIKIR